MKQPYKQSDLSLEDQKEAQKLYRTIEELIKFQNIATPKLFKWLWGDQQGEHLWEVFVTESNRDIINFLNRCSPDVKITLVCNLIKNLQLHSSTASPLYIHA